MNALKIVGATLGVIVLILLLSIGGRACTTAGQITDRTFDGDNVIFQYEWFKQQKEDYEAIVIKKRIADDSVVRFKEEAGPRTGWTFEDKDEYSRLAAISDGLKYQCEDIRSKYNARSKMLNRKIFKDNSLPHQL